MTWGTKTALLGLLAAAGIAGAWRWRAMASELARAKVDAERASLIAANVAAAKAASEAEVKLQLEEAAGQVRGFREALTRAKKAARTSVVAASSASTGPVAPEPSAFVPAAQGASCAFPEGSRGQIDVASAELRTEAGNRVLVQAAQASRVDPDGSTHLLFGGELRADLTRYLSTEVKPEKRPGWGAGPLAVCAAGGCSWGGEVAAPPMLGGHLELQAGAFSGRAGTGLLAGAVVRW